MITIYYLLDKREAYKRSKEIPILADIKYEHNGKDEHFRFSTGISCNPKNIVRQVIQGREPNADFKNTILKNITATAERIYFNGLEKGELPDKVTFKTRIKALLTDARTEKTTLDYLDSYINHLKTKGKSKHTTLAMARLRVILEALQAKGISIHLDAIDLEFETAVLQELQSRGYNVNTQGSYINRLKMFMNYCIKNNYTRNMIFKQFEITEEACEIVALTELEVEAIANLNLPRHKHITEGGTRLTRDWFIIATQTGLRYSDFRKFGDSKLVPVSGGYDIHIKKTQKTKADVVIPVSRLLYKVLKEYEFNVPPPSSNQKFNKALERITGLAKLTKKIGSHTGRKTFCTLQYLKGVPVPWIMKISGHRTEKIFYQYIGVNLSENSALVRGKNKDFQINHMTA